MPLEEHATGGHGPRLLAGDTPSLYANNWLPPQYADITAEQLSSNGLYALRRARGVWRRWHARGSARTTLEVKIAYCSI